MCGPLFCAGAVWAFFVCAVGAKPSATAPTLRLLVALIIWLLRLLNPLRLLGLLGLNTQVM